MCMCVNYIDLAWVVMDELYQEHFFFVREQLQELELRYVLREQICNERDFTMQMALQTQILNKLKSCLTTSLKPVNLVDFYSILTLFYLLNMCFPCFLYIFFISIFICF